jgi:hypothetical protein
MANTVVQEILQSYNAGELDELKTSILPFLKTHKDQLIKFIENFEKKNGRQPLESLIKYFILSYNMPFNMKFYLEKQSKTMEEDIGPEIKVPEKRHELVKDWIKNKAANYRSHSILSQIFCFDQIKKEILPSIRKELGLG